MSTNIIEQLEQQIRDDLTPIDREKRFAESLDSEGEVNVCGLTFMPSRIWREMDETAFRCGVNDYADGENWVEVNGDTYDQDECEKIKEAMVSDLESHIESVEEEVDEDAETAGEDELADLQTKLSDLQEQLATLKAHSF